MLSSQSIRLINTVSLLAAIALAVWTGNDIYQRINHHKNHQQVLTFPDEIGNTLGGPQFLTKVIETHLFGVVPKKVEKPVEKPKPVVEAPKTRLNLVLTGIVSAVPAENGLAMIEVKRGETSVVRVGQEIGKTGAKLHEIGDDHILIDRQGSIEKLQIERLTLELTSLSDTNQNTISALNISESELVALTKRDQKLKAEQEAAIREAEAAEVERERQAELQAQQQAQQEAQQQAQQQAQQSEQLVFKDESNDDESDSSRAQNKKVPGGLKRL